MRRTEQLMVTLELTTDIQAPPEVVFDCARDVEIHTETMTAHDERAVAGATSGLLEAGDEVTWKARHFGLPFKLTVRISEFDRPTYFRDEQTDGPFAEMVHDHYFETLPEGGTQMTDQFRFQSPFGVVGSLFDRVFLGWYMRRLLAQRNETLKHVAENRSSV